MDKSDIELFEEGDIVSLHHKDGPESILGRVILKDEWTFMLNNRDEYFSIVDWYVTVLHHTA